MFNRYVALGLAAAAVFAGSGALAATPTPPRSASQAELEAWAELHVVLGPYLESFKGSQTVELYDPTLLERTEDGRLIGWFRAERYWPERVAGVTYRSIRQKLEVDCGEARVKIIARELYPDSNLQGTPATVAGSNVWSPPVPEDSGPGMQIRQVCAFQTLVGSPEWAKAMPSPPTRKDADTRRTWFARNVDRGDYTLIDDFDGEAFYFRPAELERVGEDLVRATIRSEFLRPIALDTTVVRSTTRKVEIDCAHHRYRVREAHMYPGLNLLGAAFTAPADEGWLLIVAGQSDARAFRAVCRLADKTAPVEPAAAARQAPAPPPAGTTAEAIAAWKHDHINANGYVTGGHDAESVYFYDPASMELLANGNVLFNERTEYFSPQDGVRSAIATTEVDCRKFRLRVHLLWGYPESNLEGVAVENGGPLAWSPPLGPNTNGGSVGRQICGQRSLMVDGVDRDLAFLPPPLDLGESELGDWIDQHLVGDDYVIAGFNNVGVALISTTELNRTPQGPIRVWMRLERFTPDHSEQEALRSSRMLVDFDCEQSRSRTLKVEAFAGSNLQGARRIREDQEAKWSFLEPGSLLNTAANQLCSVRSGADDSISVPQLPRPKGRTAL